VVAPTAAVFFDVDFTLIHPGPRFQGSGYEESCRRHGVRIDPSRFDAAVAGAAPVLDAADVMYDADLYVKYTRRIIELMGGTSPAADRVARELYDDWAEHHHFSLYDDVRDTLEALANGGIRAGLISNSHRCLASFQSHFELDRLIVVAVSSSELGHMKPHPAIFRAALDLMQVGAGDAVMVGDSLSHDVEGARRVGMRGLLLARGAVPTEIGVDVDVIRSLREVPDHVLAGPIPAASRGDARR
jgi:HAD superfamily hydrolase (TIGR01549 family)